MGTTIASKRKVIDIPEDVFKFLSIKAAANGLNLKKYIEILLAKDVEDINDNETYKYLQKARPDGNVALNDEKREEFMNWLGVKAK